MAKKAGAKVPRNWKGNFKNSKRATVAKASFRKRAK